MPPEPRPPARLAGLRRLLVLIAIAIVVFLGLLWLGQRRLIYFPSRDVLDPALLGLARVQQACFTADDGVALAGWYLPASGAPRDLSALVCHGNAGNVSDRTHLLAALSSAGLDVLVFDYRGYGQSGDASPTEDGLYADGRAALAWLERTTGRPAARTVLYGESLGTAVCVELARDQPPYALVLESPFTSLPDAAAASNPWLPVRLLLRDRYDSLAKIGAVRAPLLVMHGTADRIVPFEQGRKLCEAAGGAHQLIAVQGADHNEVWMDVEARRKDVVAFLDGIGAPAAGR
ncbi:MAG TPA: alpha/beta hydrolase [Planctomycetota bacterium]|nr:alpha/beta hydrolase [Planctomycetota bacterium]